jgi:(1->4)-alpha-D-glucan 1-alpha-D-glucosylmutase
LITTLATHIQPFARSNSFSQKLVQLTMPGVPDVYQGSEFWEDSLVDPDNRRPVDFAARSAALAALEASSGPPAEGDHLAKLWITSRALQARSSRPELFSAYRSLRARGLQADHLIAFDRGGAITLATRLPAGLAAAGGWADTVLALPPGTYRDAFTGAAWVGEISAAQVLERYPVALLLAEPVE